MKKIRVLHYYNIMNRGGAETFIMNVFRKIDRKEIEFNFLVSSSEVGDYDNEIEKLGGIIYHINKPKKTNPIKAYKDLMQVFKKFGPFDVIHLPVSFYSGFVAMVAKKAGIKKVIVHSHVSKISFKGNAFRRYLKKVYIFIMKKLIIKYADVKIACGKEAGKLLFGNLNDVIILNNGIDVDSYNCNFNSLDLLKKEFNITNEIVIGNVARFFPVKNHYFFIKLGEYIKQNGILAKIILVGDGELKNSIQLEVKEKKLDNIISFAGVRNNINDFMKLFHVLVMPSFDEGFPVTIVEAIASGTPCVLSTGIPKETAIIHDMVSFISLDSDISEWWKKIKNYNNYVPDMENINNILKEKNFDSYVVAKKLEKIYKK